jgi:hypothetical protein
MWLSGSLHRFFLSVSRDTESIWGQMLKCLFYLLLIIGDVLFVRPRDRDRTRQLMPQPDHQPHHPGGEFH